jgi:hypothetical protein
MATNSSRNLTLSIRALVEGLRDVAALGEAFVKVSEQARSLREAGTELDNVGKKGKLAATELDKAFSTLGGRSTKELQRQIAEVAAALESVRKSGASLEEVARATKLAEQATKRLNEELSSPTPRTFGEKLAEIGVRLKNLDFKGAISGINDLGAGFSGITRLFGPLVAGFVALAGIKSFASLIHDATQLAARVETLNVTLGAVGRNAGLSQKTITEQVEKIKLMGIASAEAAESLTKMIQAGIKVSEVGETGLTKAQELARAAQDLAVVTGESSSQTLLRLITNIQQMDTVGLRFMGLTVDATSAQANFAQSIGKTVGALTESEKKQAFLNATMNEAKKLTGAYEESLETLGKKLTSLIRYQDEFKNALGQAFLGAGVALVDGAQAFLEAGQKIIEKFNQTSQAAANLKAGMKPLVDALGDLALIVLRLSLDVFDGLSVVFKQVGGLVGDVANVVRDLTKALSGLFLVGGDADDFVSKLDPIKGLFTGIGLAIAIVRDGMTFLGIGIETTTAAFSGAYADILRLTAKLVGFFSKDLGAALNASADNFKQFSDRLINSATAAAEKMQNGQSATEEFALSVGKVAGKASGTTVAMGAFTKAIEEMSKRAGEGTLAGAALAEEITGFSASLDVARANASLSEKEFKALSKQLDSVPGSLIKNFTEAAAASKVSLAEMRTGITEEVSKTANTLGELIRVASTRNDDILKKAGTSLALISQDILNTFSKIVDSSKSLDDIAVGTKRIVEAEKEHLISQAQLKEALTQNATKFDELFAAGLKAAKTKEDFDKLSKGVGDVAAAGGITRTRMIESLNAISDAMDKTKSKANELAVATQKVALSDASLKVAQAQYAITAATVDVAKARVGVWVAENKLAQDNNELNRLGVELAKLEVKVAEGQLLLARTQFKEQVQNKNLLIAKQEELNATVALEGKANDESLQKAKIAASERARLQELVTDKVKEEVNAQQENVLKIQEVQIQTKGQYDILKTVTEANAANTASVQGTTSAAGGLSTAMQGVKGSVNDVSGAINGMGQTLTTTSQAFSLFSGASAQWSASVVAEYNKVSGALRDLIQAQANLDQSGIDPGVLTTGTGMGVFGVGGKAAADKLIGSNAYNTDRNARIGAENAASSAQVKAKNLTAQDNTGMFAVQQKLKDGTLSDADEALVNGVWQAAQANLHSAQVGGALAGDFTAVSDASKWYNIARTAKAKVDALKAVKKGPSSSVAGQSGVTPGAFAIGGPVTPRAPSTVTPPTVAAPGVSGTLQAPGGGQVITKKISVDLNLGGQSVNAQIDAADEGSLLAVLDKLKKRS